MASLDVGGAAGRRKALDTSVPLVPFIDLLLCCVMFLLVTAVWNEIAAMPVDARSDGATTADDPLPDKLKLAVMIQQVGYVITTGAGDQVTLARVGTALDTHALSDRLKLLRSGTTRADITLIADDGTPMVSVTDTMDAIRGAGFGTISIGNAM